MSTAAGDLRTLAHEGHTYLYPLVTMETARRQAINLPVARGPGSGQRMSSPHRRSCCLIRIRS